MEADKAYKDKTCFNSGDSNSGNFNSGNSNSGDFNSGNRNSGDSNSGYCNSGDWNSGGWNSGDSNSGNFNSGDRNSGYCNSGKRNTGNSNSGGWNSGDSNTGNSNSGDFNSGYCNSGDWNSGDGNSGYFNIDTPPVRIFGKNTDVKLNAISFPSFLFFELKTTEWVYEADMTEKEKDKYPEYKTLGGCLKVYGDNYKDCFKESFEKKCDRTQAEQLLALPNFDYDIFEKISGITKDMINDKLRMET